MRAIFRVPFAAAASSLLVGVLQANELKIVHIRVGQGDATLILGPKVGSQPPVRVLIDAGGIPTGGRDGGNIVRTVLWKNGVSKLDYFIATHYDTDHIGGVVTGDQDYHGKSFLLGLNNVPGAEGDDDGDGKIDWIDSPLNKMKADPEELGEDDDIDVETFVDRGDDKAPISKTYAKYKAIAEAMGTRKSLATQEDVNTFEIDLGGGAKMICLSANGFVRDRTKRVRFVNTENERSLCFLLQYDGFDYLAGGDTIGRKYGNENAKVEAAIAKYITDNGISIDVLHVNHHGGNNASEKGFLDAIAAEIAVISLGNDNHYHHPNGNVLERLVASGVYRIYQTSWGATEELMTPEVRRHQAIFQGDVIIATDGKEYDIHTNRTFKVDE